MDKPEKMLESIKFVYFPIRLKLVFLFLVQDILFLAACFCVCSESTSQGPDSQIKTTCFLRRETTSFTMCSCAPFESETVPRCVSVKSH